MWSVFLLIFLTLCAGFAGWMFFLWAVKSGQYDDIEGPKYRMLEDEEKEKRKDEGKKEGKED
ncbi:MAG TPA: cbb3-type cytochrome oxidase assembly protein CcoS [Nitrospirota bacterium]|nr:cbb3-type cytochrome oxidase assembly protein CcoS [Nitrospirota bacterium]